MAISDILGNLMSSGMGGRSDAGPNFLNQIGNAAGQQGQPGQPEQDSGFMGSGVSFGKLASIAGVAAIGYKAYSAHQQKEQERAAWAAQGGQAPQQGGGMMSRITGMFGGGAHEDVIPNESKSMLLLRTMVAATAADGQITSDERNNIMQQVENANATPQERQTVEQLLSNPPTIDDVLSHVRDQDTAEQVYYAACIGMQGNSPSTGPFLDYVAQKLNLPQDRRGMIEQALYSGR